MKNKKPAKIIKAVATPNGSFLNDGKKRIPVVDVVRYSDFWDRVNDNGVQITNIQASLRGVLTLLQEVRFPNEGLSADAKDNLDQATENYIYPAEAILDHVMGLVETLSDTVGRLPPQCLVVRPEHLIKAEWGLKIKHADRKAG